MLVVVAVVVVVVVLLFFFLNMFLFYTLLGETLGRRRACVFAASICFKTTVGFQDYR